MLVLGRSRPPVRAEPLDLIPYVFDGVGYRPWEGAKVWLIEGDAGPLRFKLMRFGFRPSRSFVPRLAEEQRRGLVKPKRPVLAAVYRRGGELYWTTDGESVHVGGCPDADVIAVRGQSLGCAPRVLDVGRRMWDELAEEDESWLLRALAGRPEDYVVAIYKLAERRLRLYEAVAEIAGIGVDAVLEFLRTNSLAAVAEALFHWEAEKEGIALEDRRRTLNMPKWDFARGRRPGVYKSVAEYDFFSLFPSIVAAQGVDPLGIRECSDGVPVKTLLGTKRVCFEGGPVSAVISSLLSRRIESSDAYVREALKFLMNAGIGAWGKAGWGLVCEPCLYFVRAEAHRLFDQAWRDLEPIYGDTDSIYVEESKMDLVESWARSLRGLKLRLEAVWEYFLLAPSEDGGVAEKNYLKIRGDHVVVKGSKLRPHDLPVAARLVYKHIVARAVREGTDPLALLASVLRGAPAGGLFVLRSIESRGGRTRSVQRIASFEDSRYADVFYLPGRGVIYTPKGAIRGRTVGDYSEREIREAAVEYVRRLAKIRALRSLLLTTALW